MEKEENSSEMMKMKRREIMSFENLILEFLIMVLKVRLQILL